MPDSIIQSITQDGVQYSIPLSHSKTDAIALAYQILEGYGYPPHPSKWDAALRNAKTRGVSDESAMQKLLPADRHLGEVRASEKLAEYDLAAVSEIWPYFVDAGAKYDVPPAVLAAIASRESRCGALLKDGWGDFDEHGEPRAFGIMQIDKRWHKDVDRANPSGLDHICQATEIFRAKLDQICRKHPGWEEPYQLHGAIAAYNMGASNVQTVGGIDKGTTGDDYGADVLARAQYYQARVGGS